MKDEHNFSGAKRGKFHRPRSPKTLMITLPAELVEAIEKYNETDWPIGGIASLNAVAFIGERVAAIVAVKSRSGK